MDSSTLNEEDDVANNFERDEGEGNNRNPTSAARGKQKKNNPATRSWVWEHFTRHPTNRDMCNCHYCARPMGCATANGTTCLKNHLLICKEYKVWQESITQAQHVLQREGGDENTRGSLKLGKVSEAVFREASNELLVLAELPLAFIECLAWKHFCEKMNLYKPHSRRTATRDIVEMYVKRKAAMKKLLNSNQQRVSLTTDIWVAPTTRSSYMVITAHFIDASWKLRKLILGFKHISDHRGTTICSVLMECMADWGIKKVFTITVDNATANTNALEKFTDAFLFQNGDDALILDGEFLHMRCAAHIINLIVKDGLTEVVTSVAAIRNGVQYVRGSSKRVDAFDQKVESGKMTRGSLSLDCKTRWNSTYLMLLRALKFKLAFDTMEMEDKLYNDYFTEKVDGTTRIGPPTVYDWDEVERLVKFLVIFYNSTLVVSASTTLNSHRCYNEIITIQKNLGSLCSSTDATLRLKASAMKDKFDKYWGDAKEMNKLLIIASVLDPRNKMKFAGYCFDVLYGKDSDEVKELTKSVEKVMTQLFDEYHGALTAARNMSSSQTSQSSHSQSHSRNNSQDHAAGDLFDGMGLESDGYERMDTFYKEMVKETGFQDASTELELYLKEKVEVPKPNPLGIPFDLLGWWRINSPKYPVLAAIAKDVLAMQVSSVASESAFSTSNRILDPFRSCLTHYMIEVLMCTEQWMKCEIRINEKGVITNQQMLADIELLDELQKEFEFLQT